MKTKFLLTAIITFFIGEILLAQTEEDNIEFLRVQNQINEGNYRKALDVLSNISPQGKASPFYLSYKATCYEKLKIYDSAAMAYKTLYDRTRSFDAMKKVAEMKDKHDEKQNCVKCHGSGSYLGESLCYSCSGSGKIFRKCDKDYFDYQGRITDKSCKGTGVCAACDGDGIRTCSSIDISGKRTYHDCDCFCVKRDEGKCMLCGGLGKTSSSCIRCKGNGQISELLTCNH